MSKVDRKYFKNITKDKVNFVENGEKIKDDSKIYDYYNYLPKPLEKLFGENIISNFYSINYLFKKLGDFYGMLMILIESNKEKLDKIKISKNNYKFNQSNFIFFNMLSHNDEDDFNKLFNSSTASIGTKIIDSINNDKENKDFVSKFIKIDGVINFLYNKENPFFLNLFNENYSDTDKNFFIKLFEEYNDIRKNIKQVYDLKKNAGILSLKPFIEYDIKSNNLNITEKQNNININEEKISNNIFFKSNELLYKGLIKNINTNNSKIEKVEKDIKNIEANIKEKKYNLSKVNNNYEETERQGAKNVLTQEIENFNVKKQNLNNKLRVIKNYFNSIKEKEKEILNKKKEIKNKQKNLGNIDINYKSNERAGAKNVIDNQILALVNELKTLNDELQTLLKKNEDIKIEFRRDLKNKNVENKTVNYALFYQKNLGNESQKHSEKMREYFKKIHENLYANDGIVFFDREMSLYDLLIKGIEIDYNSLLFFYTFIESSKFKGITDTIIQINTYIYGNIKLYETNLPSFLSWTEKYVNGIKDSTKNEKYNKKEEKLYKEIIGTFFDKLNKGVHLNQSKREKKTIGNKIKEGSKKISNGAKYIKGVASNIGTIIKGVPDSIGASIGQSRIGKFIGDSRPVKGIKEASSYVGKKIGDFSSDVATGVKNSEAVKKITKIVK
jgi:hypothetical protein